MNHRVGPGTRVQWTLQLTVLAFVFVLLPLGLGQVHFAAKPEISTRQFQFGEYAFESHVPLPGVVYGDSAEGTLEEAAGARGAHQIAAGLTGSDAAVQRFQTHAALRDGSYQLLAVGTALGLSLTVKTCDGHRALVEEEPQRFLQLKVWSTQLAKVPRAHVCCRFRGHGVSVPHFTAPLFQAIQHNIQHQQE